MVFVKNDGFFLETANEKELLIRELEGGSHLIQISTSCGVALEKVNEKQDMIRELEGRQLRTMLGHRPLVS